MKECFALRLAGFLALAGLLSAGSEKALAQSFTQGDLVVLTDVGLNSLVPSSSGLLDSTATLITLDEFTTSGLLVTSNTLSNNNIVTEYGSSSEGNIQLSGNGQYLTFGAYNESETLAGIQPTTVTDYDAAGSGLSASYTNGTPFGLNNSQGGEINGAGIGLAQSSSADVQRMAVQIDASGNVTTVAQSTILYNGDNPRSVYTATGLASGYYISGQSEDKVKSGAGADQGTFYSSSATAATNAIYTAKNTRLVTQYNGNLYFSSDTSGGTTGIYKFSGSPTSSASATLITAASGTNNSGQAVNFSPEGLWFANADTLYVADTGVPKQGGTPDGGIQKWVENTNNDLWSLAYTLAPTNFFVNATNNQAIINNTNNTTGLTGSGETGFESITGETNSNGTVSLYAISFTAGDDNPDGIYAITDNLSSTNINTNGGLDSFTELATAPGDGGAVFKGVVFAPQAVPEPSTWALVALSSVAGIVLIRRRKQAQG